MRQQAGAGTLVLLGLLLLSAQPIAASSTQQLDAGGLHGLYRTLSGTFDIVLGFFRARPATAPEPAADLLKGSSDYSSLPPLGSPEFFDVDVRAGAPAAAPDAEHTVVVSEEEEGLMPSQEIGETNMITYEIKRPAPKASHAHSSPHRGQAAALQRKQKKEANSRRLYEQWQQQREADWEPNRRQLAEAPTAGLNIFSTFNESCESVTCGGRCCDSLYTYSNTGNTTCTEPADTCSSDGQCQLVIPADNAGCEGLNMKFQDYPMSTVSIEDTTLFGYSCPTDGDMACSYLNTYSTDLTVCTEGACVPDISGGLKCVPLSRGTSMYGCTAAIFAYTNGMAAVSPSGASLPREGVRVSNDIGTPAGIRADVAG